MTKILAAFGVFAVAAVMFFAGIPPFPPRGGEKEGDPVEEARIADVAPVLPLAGEVVPAFQVDVKPEIGGKIREIHVAEGQAVRKGDLLITIDDTDLLSERAGVEAEIEGARLAVEKTGGNYGRARQLFERRMSSKEEFANLEADHRIAQNDLERAQRRLRIVDDRMAKTRILAPLDGTVLDIPVAEGQVVVAAASVNSGTSLMVVADISRLVVNTHVNQLDAGKISKGAMVKVEAAGADGEVVEARISSVAPQATVKNEIKGFEVAAVVEGAGGALRPGVSVGLEVPLGKAEGVVAVPVTCVFEEDGVKVVYVAGGEKPERREVEVGLVDLSLAEIKSGLAAGERVLAVRPAEDK
jgi:RND family efflux transporter MFP subunit